MSNWNVIEADFQRDYGINLLQAIKDGMTWRRFTALLVNLGPYSVFANSQGQKEDKPLEGDKAAKALEQW